MWRERAVELAVVDAAARRELFAVGDRFSRLGTAHARDQRTDGQRHVAVGGSSK